MCIIIRNSYRVNHYLGKALVKGIGYSHLKIIVQIRTNEIVPIIGKTIKGTLMYTFDHRRHM